MTETSEKYYPTIDENFKCAYELMCSNQSHQDLMNMLKSGNVVQKQLAALKLEKIDSETEAQILLDNLTGQDGKVREAVSLKIAEFMKNPEFKKLFNPVRNCEVFLASIIDVNGNICRNILSAISNLKSNRDFCERFTSNLINLTNELIEKVKEFDLQDGKYKINKEVFKLYWYLEAIYTFYEFINQTDLKKILEQTSKINEYTIREKSAKILTHDFQDEELLKIREVLKNDTNYYVRRF